MFSLAYLIFVCGMSSFGFFLFCNYH